MRRREVIGLLGGGTAWACCARAQQNDRLRNIGVLFAIGEDDPESQSRLSALREGLAALGWLSGQNVGFEVRYGTGDPKRLRALGDELVRLRPNVILAISTPALAAVAHETSTIPIVFAVVNDPVGQGFIANLFRPGANITGFTAIEFGMIGKWMDLLQELEPPVTHAGLIYGADTSPYYGSYLEALEASRGKQKITAMPLRGAGEIEPTIARLATAPRAGLIVPADAFNSVYRENIIRAVQRLSTPTVYTYRYFTTEGGLMSYGPDTADILRRSAGYLDDILRGAQPGELPAQAPTKFEFVVNLKAARELPVAIPPSLIARADEVIE